MGAKIQNLRKCVMANCVNLMKLVLLFWQRFSADFRSRGEIRIRSRWS